MSIHVYRSSQYLKIWASLLIVLLLVKSAYR
jgi:hypothetical protein